jgi:hypothetical protein
MRPAGDVENEAIVRRAYCKRTLAVLICFSAFIGILLRPLVRVRRAGGPKPARAPFLARFPPTRGGSGWVIHYPGLPNTELPHWMVRG